MAKLKSSNNKTSVPTYNNTEERVSTSFTWVEILVTIVFIFLLALAGSMDNIIEKWTGLASAIIIMFLLFATRKFVILKNYITPLFYSVLAYVIWGGISTFYAASAKFAIFEFSKLLVALCVYLFVLFFTEANELGLKKISYIFSSVGCFFGIISVDAASLGLLSGGFKAIFGRITESFSTFVAFEQGIRINGIFGNPNTYAGFMAIAVMLSLYLVMNATDKKNLRVSIALLAVNSMAYLLAFSMGSLFIFLLACLIMILLIEKGKRVSLFLLMVETAVLSFIFSFISMPGLGETGAVSFIPVLALALNAVAIYFTDRLLRPVLITKMNANLKVTLATVLFIIIAIAGYATAAFTVSGEMELNANETVMRAVSVPGGDYTLTVDSSVPANVNIESQNNYDLMRHTSTVLFNGSNDQQIAFTVPDDSEIVKINFSSAVDNQISSARYEGAAAGDVHLNYPLLPNIIANRTQDLFANENLVQRTIFFEDGLKLFEKSPIIGRGLGGFENGVFSVQSFFYETKYTHNHYIQALCDLGIVGFALFLSILTFAVVSIIKAKKKQRSLYAVPVLAACAFQIFGQAAVDAVWSTGVFLAFSLMILALITIFCSEPIKLKESNTGDRFVRIQKLALALFLGIFILLLSGNLYAQAYAKAGVKDFDDIERLVLIDRFEYNDYKLSYIVNAPEVNDSEVEEQANIYVDDLTKVESNSLYPYIIAYQFKNYLDYDAFNTAKQGVRINKSNPNAWIQTFNIFEKYIDPVGPNVDDAADRLKNADDYVDGVLEIYDTLLERNKNSLDDITLTPYNNAFLSKLLEIRGSHLYTVDWVFTAIMTHAFDSFYAVDANQDGLPDDMTVLSGSAKRIEDGIISVTDNTVLNLNLYHKLHGMYTFKIETETPQGIKIAYNGQDQSVTYKDDEAYVTVDLADNSNEALSKFIVTFPSAAEVDEITFITNLE